MKPTITKTKALGDFNEVGGREWCAFYLVYALRASVKDLDGNAYEVFYTKNREL